MPVRIVVCVKQVVDPETPVSAFQIDQAAKRVVPAPGIPPVVNGFDENAVEAALRIKDSGEAEVTVISLGNNFVMDVMKKPLSMGADQLLALRCKVLRCSFCFSCSVLLCCQPPPTPIPFVAPPPRPAAGPGRRRGRATSVPGSTGGRCTAARAGAAGGASGRPPWTAPL